LAVQQCAPVVARDGVGGCRLRSRAFGQNLVLQAAGKRDHAILGLVRGQEFLANFLVGLPGQFHFFFLFGAHFGLKLGERRFHFVIGQKRFAACEGVFHPPQQDCLVDVNGLLAQVRSQALPHVHSQGIAGFVFLSLERQRRLCFWLGSLSRLRSRSLLGAASGCRSRFRCRGLLRS